MSQNILTEEIKEQLRVPLPAEAVKKHPTKEYLSSIKVIYMVERLNHVFGENGWEDEYEIVENAPERKMVVVRGTLRVPAFGIKRTAFGGNDNSDRGDAYKGACTDALSKMCSLIGIGMDVYKGNPNPGDDHDEYNQETEGRKRRAPKKEEKPQYENIRGFVTESNRLASGVLWLMVNGIRLAVQEDILVEKLRDSQGKEVCVNAHWATVGKKKTPVMIVDSVLGVYEQVPTPVSGMAIEFGKGNI